MKLNPDNENHRIDVDYFAQLCNNGTYWKQTHTTIFHKDHKDHKDHKYLFTRNV